MRYVAGMKMLFVLLLAVSGHVVAQQTRSEKAVWQQEEAYWRLLHDGNKTSYLALWNEHFVGWPRVENNPVGKEAIAASFDPVAEYKLLPLSVREYDKNVVITFYRATFNRNGVTRTSRLTHTWIHTKLGWQIIGGMSAEDALSATSVGQSASPPVQPPTFHVRGRILAPPGAAVTFESEVFKLRVVTDANYSYEATLPLGLYTMVVRHPVYPLLQELRRPIFRVAAPTRLVLNGALSPGRMTCDLMMGPGPAPTNEQWQETIKDVCGGEETFAVPSRDGVPFQLYIRYLRRSPSEAGYVYSGDWIATNLELPVLVEYNLFTLHADHVTYDAQRRILTATGRVVAANESGVEELSDSLTFKIEEGQALPLPAQPEVKQ